MPLIFIPYLILTGKLRQAAVATAALAGTVLLGFAFLPGASAKWWLTGYFLHAGNVGDVGSLLNQSVYALVVRAGGSIHAATPIYLGVAAVIVVLGVSAAALLHRRGQPVAGWLTCAVTGLLVSPISWDHHWVWVVPALVLLADAAVRASGARRRVCWALAAGVGLVYGDWPAHWPARARSPRRDCSGSSSARIPSWRSITCAAWKWSAGTCTCSAAWRCSRWPRPRPRGRARPAAVRRRRTPSRQPARSPILCGWECAARS